MSAPVKLDFISDVVCPWCALGVTALEQAIANLAGEVPVEYYEQMLREIAHAAP